MKSLLSQSKKRSVPGFALWIVCLAFGILTVVGNAHAALTVNSVTLDGGASVTVLPGATISVVVSETNTGGSNWGSTRFRTTDAGGTQVTTCVDTPDHNGNGTYSETFTLSASAATGVYDVSVRASSNDTCGGGGATNSITLTLTGGIVVVAPPTVTTNAATALTTSGATLNGAVSSNGASTTVSFDYGLTAAYGSTATAAQSPLAAGAASTAVSAAVTGLACNTLYHFRVRGVNSAGTTYGSNLTFTTAACPLPATCNTGAISGVLNTYYPGAASVAAGATTITVGAGAGAATGLAQGDLILVMQMQDAAITTTNDAGYGVASAVNAGKYEYATVASVVGNTVNLTAPLSNGYTAAAFGAAGQKTFQVIRVPVYSIATLGAATARAWDGSTGGVLAFDVTGTLTLAGATVDVSGLGFRGGATRTLAGGAGLNTDYLSLATVNNNGSKGEGIAGTPRYVFSAPGTVTNTGVEGYAGGSHARGSPANAGGGGTDGQPSANDRNTGGGGGGNGGVGGMGGIAWCPTFNAANPPFYSCPAGAPGFNDGGLGGKVVSQLAPAQLTLGGGGGGGTANNITGSGACAATNGACVSGATGGGLIMVRAATLSGSATFNTNGSPANNTVGNDGSGGGGAAGAVMLFATAHAGGSVTINANGGTGGTNLIPPLSSGPHGPGGGGGGGYAIRSSAVALASCNANGGAAGVTYNNGVAFGNYGATPGSTGQCVATLTAAQLPGAALGAGPCAVALHHYAISYPLGNPGVTCEAMAVRITGHDASHAEVAPAGATQITLTTAPATGGWALKSGAGTFTAPNLYRFDGTEKFAEFWLTQTTPLANININVSDGTRSEDATEDPRAEFTDTAFRYYACTGAVPATCSPVSINHQIAGKASNAAPYAQNLYLRSVIKDTTTGACTGGLAGAQVVQFAYECDNPATCYAADLLSINGGSATTIARNDDGTVSAATGTYSAANMNFTSDGYAPFNLNYADVGQITLHAKKVVTPGVGTPPSTAATIYGASNGFVVKPYAFTVTDIKRTSDSAANPGAADAAGAAFMAAGEAFSATISAVSATGAVTPSFGRESTPEGATLAHSLVSPGGGAAGTLAGTTTIPGASFQGATKGVATVTNLSWDEVGVITLKASNDNYLGNSLGACTLQTAGEVCQGTFGDSGNIGRFIPHHFDLVAGTINPADAVGGYSYMDQPFGLTFTLMAKNASGGTTTNYATTGVAATNFAMLDPTNPALWPAATLGSNSSFGLGAKDGATDLSSRLSVVGTPSCSAANCWAAGTATVTANLKFSRPVTTTNDATWGPFNALDIGVAPQDADGVKLLPAALDLDASLPVGAERKKMSNQTKVRFGRLRLINAYGSELLRPRVEYRAEYWDGSRWTINTLDSTTPLVSGNIVTGGLTVNGVTALAAGVGFISFNPAAAGSYDIALNLSVSGNDTSCNAAHGGTAANRPWLKGFWAPPASCGGVPPWAQDPNARIRLGSPRAPHIYLRERY